MLSALCGSGPRLHQQLLHQILELGQCERQDRQWTTVKDELDDVVSLETSRAGRFVLFGRTGFSPFPSAWYLVGRGGGYRPCKAGHGGCRVLPRALFLFCGVRGARCGICTLHRKRIGSINVWLQNVLKWKTADQFGCKYRAWQTFMPKLMSQGLCRHVTRK